jgi:hypothetical protein
MERISEGRCSRLAWNSQLTGRKEEKELICDNGKGTLKLYRHYSVISTEHLCWHLFWWEWLLLFATVQYWWSLFFSSLYLSLSKTKAKGSCDHYLILQRLTSQYSLVMTTWNVKGRLSENNHETILMLPKIAIFCLKRHHEYSSARC